MRQANQAHFATIPHADIQRSKFDRSSNCKTVFNAGLLIPVWTDEGLPGDTFNLRMSTFARMATPLFPILDNLYLDSFFFAVPIRLLWDNWQRFNGEQTNPGDSTSFVIPQVTSPGDDDEEGSLSDHLGIPPRAINITHSALWHRAYNFIWNEWFRDENIQDSLVVPTDDGPDTYTDYVLQRRGKRHDYFTSCLPFPQKGTAVQLPLGNSAVVTMDTSAANVFPPDAVGTPTWGTTTPRSMVGDGSSTANNWSGTQTSGSQPFDNVGLEVDIQGKLGTADLSTATSATINEIREAFQIQRLFERDARGGSRYTEIVRSHFGVVSPDQRLQRPEYLGGGSQTINITPIAATVENTNRSLGELAGYGVSQGSNHTWNKSFTEHVVLIGMVCVRADVNYQAGLARMFSRSTRFDFFWPALAHLGEQAVLNKEILVLGDAFPSDDQVFGYQERYAEYRYKPNEISHRMRSWGALTLDPWHLAQDFQTDVPTLSPEFIVEDPPMDRIEAVSSEPDFLFDAYFKLTCVRPMPTYSVPGLIDHF